MSENKTETNFQQLEELLGFNSTKTKNPDATLLNEALQEIELEREIEARKRAKEILLKAMDMQKEMVKASKEFKKQEEKFNKELGKLIGQIRSIKSGNEPSEEEKVDDNA